MSDGKMKGGGRGRIDFLRGWKRAHPSTGKRDFLRDWKRLNPRPPRPPRALDERRRS